MKVFPKVVFIFVIKFPLYSKLNEYAELPFSKTVNFIGFKSVF